jgi:serine/threonine protein kinase
MHEVFTCPHGHRWQLVVEGALPTRYWVACPLCGAQPQSSVEADQPPAAPEAEPPAPPEPSPGIDLPQLAAYEVLAESRRSGMAVVYKARQRSLERLVSVKMLFGAGFVAGAREAKYLRRESRVLSRLAHANLPQVVDYGEEAGRPFLVLEWLGGGSLREKLADGPLPPRQAAELVETLAHVVDFIHRQGFLHRDLKPGNVRFTADGSPKVEDFSLACPFPFPADQGEHEGSVVGTPSYMAPEQATGRRGDLGRATDVYGLGAVLYETLAGRPPFRGANAIETIQLRLSSSVVPPSRVHAGVPRDLEAICLKCLQREPAQRYASALELANDLRRFLNDEPITARPAGAVERLRRWFRRRPAGPRS